MQTKDWLLWIGPLVGTALGWFLSQLSQWLVVRRDEKKAIARAISNLLEVRHYLLAIPKVTDLLSKHFGLPRENHTPFKVALAQLFPADADLSKRYSDAVSLVAEANPILGFRLRSQDRILPLLDNLRKLALNDPAAVALMPALEQELMGHVTPHLERLLKELASAHGFLTALAVRRQLKRTDELPDGFLESLKMSLSQLKKAEAGPTPPPAEPGDLP